MLVPGYPGVYRSVRDTIFSYKAMDVDRLYNSCKKIDRVYHECHKVNESIQNLSYLTAFICLEKRNVIDHDPQTEIEQAIMA
jgi:uncharacterized protein YutE (UPF0331/DUF86 family)